MATTSTRVTISSGDLVDEDDINSLASQGIQVFADRAARNAANAKGVVWVVGRNELQCWSESQSKWLTLAQAPSTTPTPIGVPRPRHTPSRTDDSTVLPNWGRKDHRASIPAALSNTRTYPTKRLPNPFGLDPIPLQNVFDNKNGGTNNVLELGQTSAVSSGAIRQLEAQIDVEVHILLVGPGGPGTPSQDRNDLTFSGVNVFLAGGGGGGGELAETIIRIPQGKSIYIHGLHEATDHLSVVYENRVLLNVAQGNFAPGAGAPQAEASGLAYNAAGNALRPTPIVESRYLYPVRLGGLAYEPGPAKGEYGCAGTGASFLEAGNLGRWRGQYLTRPLSSAPTLAPRGLSLASFGAIINADGNKSAYVGGGGHGFRTQYSFDTVDLRASGFYPRKYGDGGLGGYTGRNVLRDPVRWGPVAPGPGACLIRYADPGVPLSQLQLL